MLKAICIRFGLWFCGLIMSQNKTDGESAPLKVVGLVSAGHFFSHFYGMVLPPLFPFLLVAWDVGYTELGILVGVFALASAAVQLPMGLLVDRIGPVRVLLTGAFLIAGAFLAMGLFPSYPMALVCAFAAGLGNSVYHPADYLILSTRVPAARLGRAFSVHTFSGHLGWAAGAASMGLLAAFWDWQVALILAGAAGLAMALVLFMQRDLLTPPGTAHEEKEKPQAASFKESFSLLLSLPVLCCFAFFVFIAMSSSGFQSFYIAAVGEVQGTVVELASLALTCYFGASAAGILVGGLIADRTQRHGLVAALGYGAAAVMIFAIGQVSLPDGALIPVMMLCGFAAGIVPPSRDLMVRAVTPPGATGTVFAFVAVGLDVGAVITPSIFGLILDFGSAEWVFTLTAIILLLAIGTVLLSRQAAGQVREGSAAAE